MSILCCFAKNMDTPESKKWLENVWKVEKIWATFMFYGKSFISYRGSSAGGTSKLSRGIYGD